VLVLIVLAALSEVAYVRVPHGDSTEDLTFFEAVVITAAIVLPPAHVLGAALAGLVTACVVLRRPLVKTAFNIGTYAAGTSVLLLMAHAVAGPWNGRAVGELDAWVIGGLLLGTAAFAGVNLLALASVLAVVEGKHPDTWLREEWATSAVMVIGSVGIGAVGVELAMSNPLLLPFTGLPILALMRSYVASQQHARARERANALVALNSVLASGRGADELVVAVRAPLRTLFGVDDVTVVLPGDDVPELGTDDLSVALHLGDEDGALVLHRDGSALRRNDRPVRARAALDLPMVGAVASAVASVLRASRHLTALTEESSKLQAVVDHATDGIAVVDSDGRVLVWSPAMRELVGDPPASLPTDGAGGPVVALLAGLSTTPEATATSLVRSLPILRPRAKTEVTVIGRHGDERDLDVSVARIGRGADGDDLAVVTLHDATQERRLEKMKSDFVATVSHELKTPITPIKGYARLLASRGDRMEPARRLHALQLIEDRADHLSRLVDDLLLASRVVPSGPGKLKVDLADMDMRNVVRQATSAFALLSHRLEVHLPSQPVPVRCDMVRAVQCLSNLVGNAEKYSPGVTPIRVELVEAGGSARVVVTDQGRGIAAADLDRIFERFSRLEDPFTMQTSGSGLGLYIARELARAMGGDITVTSELGEGSAFAFTLPICAGDGSGGKTQPPAAVTTVG
jgi:signal transduction histidine kinase